MSDGAAVRVPESGERARIRESLERLHATLSALASELVARIDERCPYRARQDRCTFAAGCVNQRRARRRERDVPGDERVVRCGGDQQLRRTNA
jgi:hypothetical protein